MNLARSVAQVLAEHVSFELECIDRMYCNVYVPGLQYPAGLVGYVHRQLGLPVPSTAPLGRISDRFTDSIHRFARQHQIPEVDFGKGERKDDVMAERLARFEAAGGTEGVVFIGRAQEKTAVFRTEKRRNPAGRSYPWIVKTTAVPNHFYFYCLDADFGPFFIKFCSYFPYNAKLCFNGNHWAQHQAAKAGIRFTAMDNAFGTPPRLLPLITFGAEKLPRLTGLLRSKTHRKREPKTQPKAKPISRRCSPWPAADSTSCCGPCSATAPPTPRYRSQRGVWLLEGPEGLAACPSPPLWRIVASSG